VRSGIRVARALGLGGLARGPADRPALRHRPRGRGRRRLVHLLGDGTVRRMSLDVGQVNAAFEQAWTTRAPRSARSGARTTISSSTCTPPWSRAGDRPALLGRRNTPTCRAGWRRASTPSWWPGAGDYSFKGSGYVRGGVFDRIVLIQGDTSVRFQDRDHRRLGSIAADGAPRLSEVDLFRIPTDAGFDPTQPWRLQLLVQRDVAAIERVFTTFDLRYALPGSFLRELAPPARADVAHDDAEERAAQAALIERIWRDKTWEIAGLLAMLTVLTGAFFFQSYVTRSEHFTFWFRMSFLTVTLVFLGWYANAQLSIVNLMALVQTLTYGFSWQAFLLDPLTFILWWSVAAALIFWGRGAYCGWLCPFGALQELTNRIARWFRVPQWRLPWGLHERLWPVKYVIFLGLFGVTLASLERAEQLAEVEPFKTAIVLNFDRAWPFVLYVLVLLGIGLFVERFYCRYLCPLGAALAIPARIRMFDWLKRYRECGNPCQTCAHECMVQAIHPTGEINPNECLNCMNCQVLYQSKSKCPVVIRQLKRREAVSSRTQASAKALDRALKNSEAKRESAEG
jgi:NosR/NirI family transcriptional regulator, nitrous oxide reductase regulator